MKATYTKRSICSCGHPILVDEIPLGVEYEIYEGTEEECTLVCGGCGKKTPVTCIQVAPRFRSHGGLLPKEIFSFAHKLQ